MNKILCLIPLLIFPSMGCKKTDVPKDTPKCIKQKIRSGESLSKVFEYKYNGKDYYEFQADCCDNYNYVYDSDCNLICTSGGVSGQSVGDCESFYKNRTNEVLIWDINK